MRREYSDFIEFQIRDITKHTGHFFYHWSRTHGLHRSHTEILDMYSSISNILENNKISKLALLYTFDL